MYICIWAGILGSPANESASADMLLCICARLCLGVQPREMGYVYGAGCFALPPKNMQVAIGKYVFNFTSHGLCVGVHTYIQSERYRYWCMNTSRRVFGGSYCVCGVLRATLRSALVCVLRDMHLWILVNCVARDGLRSRRFCLCGYKEV